MKQIKIGVIGLGGIARYAHLLALKDMTDRVKVVAICDINPAKFEGIEEILGYKVDKKYEKYEDLLKDGEVEAVHILTPNYLHSIITVAALKAGKHVFCEKPDAINTVEVKKMQEAAKNSDRMLMVMRNNRYLINSQYLKKFVEEGKAGEIYAGRCGWTRRRGIPGKGGWFTTKAQSGGGPLIDLGVHMIDLAIYLMGNPVPVAVSGSTYCKFANADDIKDSGHSAFGDRKDGGTFDVEDLAMGFIKFDNGACLQIEFSWASNTEKGDDMFVELRGTKAGFKWTPGHYTIYGEDNGVLTDTANAGEDKSWGHKNNIEHFYDCLLNGEKPKFTIDQGVDMIKILEAIYKSAETGKEIVL